MSDKIGLFTGTFDPVTNGHLDLIERAIGLFDHLYVGIFSNPNKDPILDIASRTRLLEQILSDYPRTTVVVSKDELVVDAAKRYGVTHLVRGLRNSQDLEYEASFDFYNRALAPQIETVYLLARPEHKFVSSSQVRELLQFHQDIAPYVPSLVAEEFTNHEKN